MVTDKKGNIFEDRRKQDVEVKKDKRKGSKTKNKLKQNKKGISLS